MATAVACRWHGIGSATFYKRKAKNGELMASEVKRMRSLEVEHAKQLPSLVWLADSSLMVSKKIASILAIKWINLQSPIKFVHAIYSHIQ